MLLDSLLPKVAVCIASGPSLRVHDIARAKHWRESPAHEERRVVVVNTSFRLAPWADAMYAANDDWWAANGAELYYYGAGTTRIALPANGPTLTTRHYRPISIVSAAGFGTQPTAHSMRCFSGKAITAGIRGWQMWLGRMRFWRRSGKSLCASKRACFRAASTLTRMSDG